MRSRRSVLAAVGASSAVLAGCVSGGVGAPTNPDDDDGLSGSIETVSSDCGGPDDDWASAHRVNDVITLEGLTPAPNPCHEATLDAIEVSDGTLSVTIDVSSTLAADEDCIQCHGAIGYDADIEVGDRPIDEVRISHERGEMHVVEPEDGSASPQIETVSIETVDRRCASGESDMAQAAVEEATIHVSGVRPAPTPCYLAILDEYRTEDRAIEFTIGVEEDLPDDGACASCIGQIEYEVIIELAAPVHIDEVIVQHVDHDRHVIQI